MTAIWRADALLDLQAISKHIEAENPLAARRVANALVVAADSLQIFPRGGRIGRVVSTRELLAVQPYLIVYEFEDEDIYVH